jgi:hypothetical protein
MNLCEIPTNDPKNPVLIDPEIVKAVVSSGYGGSIIHVGRNGGTLCFIAVKPLVCEVRKLLEAHREPSGCEATLIAGLRRLADPSDGLTWGKDSVSEHVVVAFAQHVLRDAGVADAEPEKEGKT